MRSVKRIKFALIAFTALSCMTSCHSDEPEVYFVRYKVVADADKVVTIYYRSESNEDKVIQASAPDGRFEYTTGAVNSNFEANVTASYQEGGAVRQLTIEVSKDGEPFVTKTQATNQFSLSYTIP